MIHLMISASGSLGRDPAAGQSDARFQKNQEIRKVKLI